MSTIACSSAVAKAILQYKYYLVKEIVTMVISCAVDTKIMRKK